MLSGSIFPQQNCFQTDAKNTDKIFADRGISTCDHFSSSENKLAAGMEKYFPGETSCN